MLRRAHLRNRELAQFQRSRRHHKIGSCRATQLLQFTHYRWRTHEELRLHRVVAPYHAAPVKTLISGLDQHPAFRLRSVLRRDHHFQIRRSFHPDIQPRRHLRVRKAYVRRSVFDVSRNHQVAAIPEAFATQHACQSFSIRHQVFVPTVLFSVAEVGDERADTRDRYDDDDCCRYWCEASHRVLTLARSLKWPGETTASGANHNSHTPRRQCTPRLRKWLSGKKFCPCLYNVPAMTIAEQI